MSDKIFEMMNDVTMNLEDYDDSPLNESEAAAVKSNLHRHIHMNKTVKQNGLKKWIGAAACAALLFGVGSGAAYAAAGTGPINMLSKLFAGKDTAVIAQLADSASETETTLSYPEKNVSYTLESHWYDREKGILMEQVTVKTLNDQPFITVEEASRMLDQVCDPESYQDPTAFIAQYNSGDPYALEIYKSAVQKTLEDEQLYWSEADISWYGREQELFISPSEFQYNKLIGNINADSGEIPECIQVGPHFAIEENLDLLTLSATGHIPSVALDTDALTCCREAYLTCESVTLYCNAADASELDAQIDQITVTLKDGTSYSFDRALFESGNAELPLMSLSSTANTETGLGFITMSFEDLIDTSSVASVMINGTECLPQ